METKELTVTVTMKVRIAKEIADRTWSHEDPTAEAMDTFRQHLEEHGFCEHLTVKVTE